MHGSVSSGFQVSGSQFMIDYIYIFGDIVHNFHLIVTKYELVRDMTCIFVYINFHRDVSRIVDARVLTDKQTNKQTNSSENILPARSFTSRGEKVITGRIFHCQFNEKESVKFSR